LPKLGPLSGEDVCRILNQYGFERVRQRGSHVVMQKGTDQGTTTVPVPLHRELRRGTLHSIIRQSGLPREAFEAGE
jgi:predicted RNA binding protein YcfA (HicA-like mRNA interferase family)